MTDHEYGVEKGRANRDECILLQHYSTPHDPEERSALICSFLLSSNSTFLVSLFSGETLLYLLNILLNFVLILHGWLQTVVSISMWRNYQFYTVCSSLKTCLTPDIYWDFVMVAFIVVILESHEHSTLLPTTARVIQPPDIRLATFITSYYMLLH